MKKLTKNEVNDFKDLIKKLLFEVYYLESMFNVYIKITYKYDKAVSFNPVNTFEIKVYYKLTSASDTTHIVYFYFFQNLLSNYQHITSNKLVGVKPETIDHNELKRINEINNLVVKFYKVVNA